MTSRGKTTPASTPGSFQPATGARSRVQPSPDGAPCAWCGAGTFMDDDGVLRHQVSGGAGCGWASPETSAMIEPEGMVVEQDGNGSWTALHRGLWSGTYGGRAQAIAGWHRVFARSERDAAIAASMNRMTSRIEALTAEHGDEFGEITFGYIGNVDPSGRNDHRSWSVWAADWRDPSHVYPTNPVAVHLGSTDDVIAVDDTAADALVAKMADKLRDGIASGRFVTRHRGR